MKEGPRCFGIGFRLVSRSSSRYLRFHSSDDALELLVSFMHMEAASGEVSGLEVVREDILVMTVDDLHRTATGKPLIGLLNSPVGLRDFLSQCPRFLSRLVLDGVITVEQILQLLQACEVSGQRMHNAFLVRSSAPNWIW